MNYAHGLNNSDAKFSMFLIIYFIESYHLFTEQTSRIIQYKNQGPVSYKKAETT